MVVLVAIVAVVVMMVVVHYQQASCLPRLVGGQYVLRLQVIRSSVQETHVDKVIAHWLRVVVLIALQANASQHCDWCCCCCGHRHVWECRAVSGSANASKFATVVFYDGNVDVE